jgi:hypothetical protein
MTLKKKKRTKSVKITTKRFSKEQIPRNFAVATPKLLVAASSDGSGPGTVALDLPLGRAFPDLQPSAVPSAVIPSRPRVRTLTFPPRAGLSPADKAQGTGQRTSDRPSVRPSSRPPGPGLPLATPAATPAPSRWRPLTARRAPASPVLSFAEKPGELSLARLGLGGPSSKFSAIFTCSRKQP